MTLRLIFVRHGETISNRRGIMQGRTDVPLSGQGRAQAAAVGRRLAREKIDVIYSSPLSRARATAEAIARGHRPPVQVRIVPELVERDYGKYEGMRFDQIPPSERRKFGAHPADIREKSHGGESWLDVGRRVGPFLRSILGMRDKTVVVVSHGGAIRTMLCEVLGLPLTHNRIFWMRNTAVSEVSIGRDFVRLSSFNDTRHLEGFP